MTRRNAETVTMVAKTAPRTVARPVKLVFTRNRLRVKTPTSALPVRKTSSVFPALTVKTLVTSAFLAFIP